MISMLLRTFAAVVRVGEVIFADKEQSHKTTKPYSLLIINSKSLLFHSIGIANHVCINTLIHIQTISLRNLISKTKSYWDSKLILRHVCDNNSAEGQCPPNLRWLIRTLSVARLYWKINNWGIRGLVLKLSTQMKIAPGNVFNKTNISTCREILR